MSAALWGIGLLGTLNAGGGSGGSGKPKSNVPEWVPGMPGNGHPNTYPLPPRGGKPGSGGGGSDDDGGGGRGPGRGGPRIPPIVIPPPPPPPLWFINLFRPPPRPGPGKTTQPRPPVVRIDDGFIEVIDLIDQYSDEGNDITVDPDPPVVPAPWLLPLPDEYEDGDPDDQDRQGCLSGKGPLYRDYWPQDPKTTRATGADACIDHTSLTPPGANQMFPYSAAGTPVAGFDNRYHDRAHLIGAWAGGVGINPANLVPMHRDANQREMFNNFERCVRDHLRANPNERVHITAIPAYQDPNALVPLGVQLQAVGNKGFYYTLSIWNQGGVGRAENRMYCV